MFLKRLFLLMLLMCSLSVTAQQEINIRVQVNRLPTGSYPTKVYQLNNQPGLVTITLTNRTQNSYTLYLNGAITGDNGVKVTTARNYQPGTLELKPLETRILNAIEAGNLFDPNHLVYSNGNTSIRSSVFGEQGLPEGTYQVCVRAFNAANKFALSEEDPMGCSNIFNISTLEPPMILNPFQESMIRAEPVQNIPLRWTTPPGAPPSTEYRIRIVELFNNRNPNDAILSTPTPFFETTVRGTPVLLYSMQYPRLQEGRSYAMIVIAEDPLGNASFRNRGRSEVIRFTYSSTLPTGNAASGNEPADVQYATNSIKGKLVWTFKKTEQGSHSIYLNSGSLIQQAATAVTPTAQSSITSYAGSAFTTQAAITPLISFNSLAAVNTDNTLLNYKATNSYINSPIISITPLPTNILSASQAMETSCTYENILPDSGADRHPLANVHFTLSAVAPGAATALLATGQTDREGNFKLPFLHPSYGNNASPAELLLSVQTTDFENTSFRIPASVLNGKTNVDIGQFVLLAKTYRFFPKVIFPKSDDVNAGSYGYHIYREASEVESRPWLAYEGKGGNKNVQVVDGRRVIEIAADSVNLNRGSANSVLAQIATVDAKGAGRIFLGGKIIVKIYPSGSSSYNISSDVNVFNASVASNKILVAKATYELKTKPSHIEGIVGLSLDDQGTVPISGATVRVMWKTDDVVPGSNSPLADLSDRELYAPASAAAINSYTSSWTNYNVHDPGVTVLQAIAYSITDLTYKPAVAVSQASNGQLSAQMVTEIPSIFAEALKPVPQGYKAKTVTTDETGNYYAGNLPVLKPNAGFSVEVIQVPYEFRTFVVRPKQKDAVMPVAVMLAKGISKKVDFTVDADVADVVGRIVDAAGKPIANARISYKGAILTQSGPGGIFQFKIFPGNHLLSLEKEGYVIKSATINVPQLTGSNSEEKSYQSQWVKLSLEQKHQATLARIAESPTVKSAVSQGNSFSAAMFGYATDTKTSIGQQANQFTASLVVAFGMAAGDKTPQYETPRKFAVDVKDIGYLNKITGKVRFRLVDEAANRIANATIALFDTAHATDANGEWYYEGFGGATTVSIVPPAGSAFIAEQKSFTLAETGQEQILTITLQKGVKISGVVRSGSQPLANARILLDEKDFTALSTDAQGNYIVYTSAGEHSVGARKQNFVGEDKLQVIPAAGAVINFDLKGGSGKNYSTLLGFAIELSSVTKVSDKQEKWTGAFVNLKPANATAFVLKGNERIPFNNVTVNFDGSGNPTPAGNEVKTDLTSLSFKLFGFLPVKLQTEDVITFTKAADGSGQLSGTIQADFASLQGYRGYNISNAVPLLLGKTGAAAPEKITIFSSTNSPQQAVNSFSLLAANSAKASGELYGFKIVVNSGLGVDQNGVEITGSIGTPALGPIKSMNIGIKRLFLNRSLVVGAVEVQSNDLPRLEIGSWKASINNLLFNEDGFKLGGNIAVYIPRSDSSHISFNDLVIAGNGVFGGSFIIPESGINILSVAKLNGGAKPLSFGRLGNSNVYRIGGSASLKINVEVMSKSFDVPSFEVMTNGDFSVQVPANYNTNIGPFGFSVSNIYINTKDNTPFIGVQGGFRADFDFIKFELADIKIMSTSSGPSYSIEKVGIKLDVPVLKTEAYVKFNKDGFEGGGKISIAGTPIAADASLKYYKRAGGIELGANFFANIPPLPIGAVVTLEGIGGGFEYKSSGPAAGFAVDIRGKVGFLGTGAAVALNPVGLTVSSAGILKGYGDVVVASYLTVGHAEAVFNGPDRTFSVQIDAGIEPIKGLIKQKVFGTLLISAKPNDEFAFLGCGVEVKMLGLINNHGELAVGIRVKDPKTRGDVVSKYFQYAPDEYMGDRFSGAYINVSNQMGIPKDNALGFDLFVVSAKLWASTEYQASLLANFDQNAYRIRFGGKFEAGVEACVADIACIGISAGLCYLVEGGYNDAMGWNFAARASGEASLGFGIGIGDCDPGCNEVVTFWDGCIGGAFKVCGAASLDFNFSERNGLRFSASAGGSVNPCF